MPSAAILIVVLLYSASPSLIAIAVTRGRVLRGPWRVRRAWPVAVAALLGPIVVGLAALLSRTPIELGTPAWIVAIGAPLGEELGWRGALGPWLERRLGWLVGALVTGLAWGFWHAPMSGSFAALVPFALGLACASVVISMLVEQAGGSLVVALVAHASMNLGVVRADVPTTAWIGSWAALAVLSVVVRARAARRSTPAHPDTAAPPSPPRP